MKKITTILGAAALAGVAYKLLTHKKPDGSTLLDDITGAGKEWGGKINEFVENKGWKDKFDQFVETVKDKLMPDLKGPNGEAVYTDMYKRNYYTDPDGSRIYMDEV